MCNKLCAFIHDALTIVGVNTRGRPSTISIDHTNRLTPRNGHCSMGTDIFPLGHFPDLCVRRDTTRSANAALTAGEPTNELTN